MPHWSKWAALLVLLFGLLLPATAQDSTPTPTPEFVFAQDEIGFLVISPTTPEDTPVGWDQLLLGLQSTGIVVRTVTEMPATSAEAYQMAGRYRAAAVLWASTLNQKPYLMFIIAPRDRGSRLLFSSVGLPFYALEIQPELNTINYQTNLFNGVYRLMAYDLVGAKEAFDTAQSFIPTQPPEEINSPRYTGFSRCCITSARLSITSSTILPKPSRITPRQSA
jgi:hypothetical protein